MRTRASRIACTRGCATATWCAAGAVTCSWATTRFQALTGNTNRESERQEDVKFEIGDLVQHTNSRREGRIRTLRNCPDGSTEMLVDIDFDDVWWNSRHVRVLEPSSVRTPKLVLKSARSMSVTYSFETEGDRFRSWALCTVNDQTGELLISSDWGSWSHRWNASPSALGAPTLTAFIGDRGDVDYLARKLQKEGRGGQVFSTRETARALRWLLCERRLNDGRCQLENRLEPEDLPPRSSTDYTPEGLPLFSGQVSDHDYMKRLPYLTIDVARRIWDEIGDLAEELNRSNGDLFYERLESIDGFTEYVTGEPREHGATEQTFEDKVLRYVVLPALIEACKDNHARGSTSSGDARRIECRCAFVGGYVASRFDGYMLGQEAEDAFNRWWNDSAVAEARTERLNKETLT